MGLCQCPERGDLHFYEDLKGSGRSVDGCVNALKGATFISTDHNYITNSYHVNCVNALKGATFISTHDVNNGSVKEVCQCPERGDLHFYPRLWEPA